jgi:hypothetical protein
MASGLTKSLIQKRKVASHRDPGFRVIVVQLRTVNVTCCSDGYRSNVGSSQALRRAVPGIGYRSLERSGRNATFVKSRYAKFRV